MNYSLTTSRLSVVPGQGQIATPHRGVDMSHQLRSQQTPNS
ncbi:MAG: hypothetical protein ACTS2F_24715 [Thainema sp.]